MVLLLYHDFYQIYLSKVLRLLPYICIFHCSIGGLLLLSPFQRGQDLANHRAFYLNNSRDRLFFRHSYERRDTSENVKQTLLLDVNEID